MEWISVKDRVPEEDRKYLVFAPSLDKDKPLITTAFYDPSGMCWRGIGIPAVWGFAITHWMPLPETPRTERRRDWDYYKDDNNYYIILKRSFAGYEKVTEIELCDALNGTAQSLLEFAGVECECGCDEGPYEYLSLEGQLNENVTFKSYKIRNADGLYLSGKKACDLLNNSCHREHQMKPHRVKFGWSGDQDRYQIVTRVTGSPLSPEYICDLLNEERQCE